MNRNDVTKNMKFTNNKEELYFEAKNTRVYENLVELILDEENIKSAYYQLKQNSGSKTVGVDNMNIKDLEAYENELVDIVRERFADMKFDKVRRVFIPKEHGKRRPIGIPTILDRLVEKCVLQILEPILETRFHENSFGFRPSRSANNAIAKVISLGNSGYRYSVDIDIEGFFDNVDHGKLRRQLWFLGIRDNRLLRWISLKLKGTIVEPDGTEVKVDKGTPQGGIISPLLANVALNEFDWWIASQWSDYRNDKKSSGKQNYEKWKRTNLKRIFFVRYADDIKILTDNYESALRIKTASIDWLSKRLKLKCNEDKTVIRNMNKGGSNYLGVKIFRSKSGYMSTKMSKKSKNNCVKKIRNSLKEVRKLQNRESILKFNRKVMGMHNYYDMCTRVSKDFSEIYWRVRRSYMMTFNKICKRVHSYPAFYKDVGTGYYGYSSELFSYQNLPIINPYTVRCQLSKNRQLNKSIKANPYIAKEKVRLNYKINSLLNSKIIERSETYIVNRAMKFAEQKGKCFITNRELDIKDVHCHHIKPVYKGGDDSMENLVIVHKDVHKAIHSKEIDSIEKRFNIKLGKNKIKLLYDMINSL